MIDIPVIPDPLCRHCDAPIYRDPTERRYRHHANGRIRCTTGGRDAALHPDDVRARSTTATRSGPAYSAVSLRLPVDLIARLDIEATNRVLGRTRLVELLLERGLADLETTP